MNVPGNDTYLIVASLLSIYHISIDGVTAGSVFQGGIFSHYVAVDYDYRWTKKKKKLRRLDSFSTWSDTTGPGNNVCYNLLPEDDYTY